MQRGRSSRPRRGAVLVGIVVLIVAALVPTAGTAAAATGGGDRNSRVSNFTLGSLSAAWWKYVLAQPATTNPLVDPSGAGCRTSQTGPVFFLVGSQIGPVTRTECPVPRGKALFFPMVNVVNFATAPEETPRSLWDQLHIELGFTATALRAEIDGHHLVKANGPDSRYRGCVGPDRACAFRSFSIDLPADNWWNYDARTYRPAVADGYYVLVPPLKPGKHTIKFGGTGILGEEFTQDVVYRFTVQ